MTFQSLKPGEGKGHSQGPTMVTEAKTRGQLALVAGIKMDSWSLKPQLALRSHSSGPSDHTALSQLTLRQMMGYGEGRLHGAADPL